MTAPDLAALVRRLDAVSGVLALVGTWDGTGGLVVRARADADGQALRAAVARVMGPRSYALALVRTSPELPRALAAWRVVNAARRAAREAAGMPAACGPRPVPTEEVRDAR